MKTMVDPACNTHKCGQHPETCKKEVAQAPDKNKVSFHLLADPGSNVFVAGSFNGWNPAQFRLSAHPQDNLFGIELTLPPGRHEYKFVVNGEWRLDPSCPDWRLNCQGTLNSVVSVHPPTA